MKTFIAGVLCLFVVSCGVKETEQSKGAQWECVINSVVPTGLYRYVDEKYGIIIYMGDMGRMTSQPIPKNGGK